jgi:NADH:ubiquinone oxidoreductase subunit
MLMIWLKRMFTWWLEATVGTMLMTWWKGELVGSDEFGHRYYREKGGPRRWVIYNGGIDASAVPPEWHAWLHRMVDAAPSEQPVLTRPWEKAHQANLTGTPEAYRPPGHVDRGGQRDRTTGDYEAWRPE